MTPDRALARILEIGLALPEVSHRLSHGAPTLFVRGKRSFVMLHHDHHGDGRLALWCSAGPGVQDELVTQEPERFFRPPYVGPRGWIGVRLDVDLDWDEIEGIVTDAYRNVAPSTLLRGMDAAAEDSGPP